MRKVICALVLILIVSCAATPGPLPADSLTVKPGEIKGQINDFDLTYIAGFASENYYREIDQQNCVAEIIKGGIQACLGKHSEYFTPKEFKELLNGILGTPYGGIGIYATIEDIGVVVTSVSRNYSAFRAGVREGDIILGTKENGKETIFKGTHLEDTSSALLGKIGTSLTLLILRGEETLEMRVNRQLIKPWHVIAHNTLLTGDVGYMRIVSWARGAAEQLKEITDSLSKMGAKKNIIDVRNNPGGIFEESLSALTRWEDDQNATLSTMHGKNPKEEIYTRATLQKKNWPVFSASLKDVPCAVLINRHSASASEIFAAYLKLKGCHIIGEESYGKGTVQSIVPLKSGAGFKLTTAEYFAGQDIKVDGVGVSPTMSVSNPAGWRMGDITKDYQLKAALRTLNKE